MRFGKPIGKAIKELISIVTPPTFQGWVHDEKKEAARQSMKNKTPGRPRTPGEIRQIVIRLAKELQAPDIQEEILFLPKTVSGHDPIKLRHLQAVAREREWGRQRERWQASFGSHCGSFIAPTATSE